jgi:Putative zinc-finger
MTCLEVQRVLPELLEGAPDSRFQTDFESHLKSCPDCSDLLSDLNLIASESRQLAASEDPSPRVWQHISAQLRAEGLIRDNNEVSHATGHEEAREREFVSARPILLPSVPRRRWNAWWLAPVAATVLAAGAYFVSHQPAPQVARQATPPVQMTVPASVSDSTQVAKTSTPTVNPIPAQASVARESKPSSDQIAQKSQPDETLQANADTQPDSDDAKLNDQNSNDQKFDDQQFLTAVSTNAPSMRATYENQLQAVNADIRETQAYVNRNPGDADARQHLMDAYEQKALLYQIALDRIQ